MFEPIVQIGIGLLYALVNGTIDNALLSNGKLNLIRRNVKHKFVKHP